ncbi:MAG: hypothetical protein GYA14_00760 [Ignavibacteria bacterium]|nr:hypothetical protein [Ignavibacteria bacterium]
MEEKQSIIKDRVIMIGNNLVSEKDKVDEEISELKKNIMTIGNDVKRLKMMLEGVIETNSNFVKRSEFEILERQFKMFEPLNLARMTDVENLVKKAISTKKT